MKKILLSFAIISSLFTLGLAEIPSAFATTTQLGSLSIIMVPLDQKTITVTPPASNSPGQWSLSLDNTALASINGLTLTLRSVGSGQLTFTQAASGAYGSASRTTVFRITPGTPTLGSWLPMTASLSTNQFKIAPPASSSDGTWSYSLSNNVVDGNAIATINGTTITLLDGGIVTINAYQSPTSTYLSASSTTTLQITALKPVVGPFSDITVSKNSIGSFNLNFPTSTSPGKWTFTSSLPNVATSVGTLITPIGVGTTVITAHQSPASGYQSATVSLNLTIAETPPTTGVLAPISYTMGSTSGNTLTLTAPTSNSSGPWVFTVTDPTIATISGSTLTILKAGSTTVTAEQGPAGNFGYSAVLTAALVINQLSTLPKFPNLSQVVGDPPIVITPPTTQSSGAWSLTASDPTVAMISGLTITVGNAGVATLTLTQAAQGSWLANSTTFSITVAGLVPTIGSLSPITLGAGDAPVLIANPSSNSTGVWSYSTANSSIAKIVDGQLVPVAAGSTTLSGVEKPAGKYGQSNTVQSTITVLPVPTLAPMLNISMAIGQPPVSIPTPKSQSEGVWSWVSSVPSVAKVSNGTIVPISAGTTKIALTQAGTPSYAAASTSFTVTVKAAPVKPTKKPIASKSRVVPIVSAKVIRRTIMVSAKNGKVIVMINGRLGKVGVNTARAGKDLVVIKFDARIIYSKVFTIK